MTWKVEFTPAAAKQLKKVGPENGRRIVRFLQGDICRAPRKHGKLLRGALREFWRYRVGDYRILARIEDNKLVIIVVSVGHRREIYR